MTRGICGKEMDLCKEFWEVWFGGNGGKWAEIVFLKGGNMVHSEKVGVGGKEFCHVKIW